MILLDLSEKFLGSCSHAFKVIPTLTHLSCLIIKETISWLQLTINTEKIGLFLLFERYGYIFSFNIRRLFKSKMKVHKISL